MVTGHCGPEEFRVLLAVGIKSDTTDAPTVAEALEKFKSGQLIPARYADVEGH